MTSDFNTKITKVKTALEAVFIKKADIKDNLTSTDTDKPLSAKQGKQLNDNKASITHTHGNLQNDGSVGTSNNASKNVVTDSNGKITTEAKPTIPSKISDLTNDSNFIETSSTTGLIKNDGSIDTSTYLTSHQDISGKANTSDLGSLAYEDDIDLSTHDVSELTDTNDTAFTPKSHNHGNLLSTGQVGLVNNQNMNVVTNAQGMITVEDKPTIPSASSTVPSADSTNGSYGSGTTYARANHQHPKSSLYAEANHNHNSTYLAFNDNETFTALTDDYGLVESNSLSSVATSGSYNDLSNKPSIPQQNVFYGTCSSSASGQTKVVSVDDWSFTTGNVLFVNFSFANTYDGTPYLQIGEESKPIRYVYAGSNSQYHWRAGEMVAFVYGGDYMIMVNEGLATTTYYGVTKLSSDIDSTSEILSATPKAVKTAYDLANGKASSTHTHGNISTEGKLNTTGTVDVSRGDLLLFADATTGTDQYKIKGSSFIDALNDLVLDLIDEGES